MTEEKTYSIRIYEFYFQDKYPNGFEIRSLLGNGLNTETGDRTNFIVDKIQRGVAFENGNALVKYLITIRTRLSLSFSQSLFFQLCSRISDELNWRLTISNLVNNLLNNET